MPRLLERCRRAAAACLFGIGLLWPCCIPGARAQATENHPEWLTTFVTRLEALALLQTLSADLLSHDSATATLERWCGVHRLASPPRMIAVRVAGQLPASPEQRMELAVSADERVNYRHVRLMCGARVLSEADNWYVPGRLTSDMNRLLEATDTPFGKVVQPLHFQRRTLASVLLWSPLPDAWEMSAAPADTLAAAPMPARLLQQRALLSLPDGTPISEVVESYTSELFDFPPPPLPPTSP